jgi:uncharacterized protein (TIGR04222 family)
MNPFDLPGLAFLALYLASLVASLLVFAVVRVLCRHRAAARAAEAPLPKLTLTETAMLFGGPERALEATLAALGDAGAVKSTANDELSGSGFLGLQPDPVAAEVHAALARRPATWAALRRQPWRSLRALERRLEHAGLLMHRSAPEASCRRAATLPLLVLFACGLIKLFIGMHRARPVGLLVMLLAVTAVLWWGLRSLPRRTALGDRVAEHLTRRNAALGTTASRRGEALAGSDLLLAVALYGALALPASGLAWMRPLLVPPLSTRSRDGSGGSDNSCGSNCGGGGGCGGCGS